MKSLYRFGRFAVFAVAYFAVGLLLLTPLFLMWILGATAFLLGRLKRSAGAVRVRHDCG